jgi:hypothetical protein
MSHDYIPITKDRPLPFAQNLYNHAIANYTKWGVPSLQQNCVLPA